MAATFDFRAHGLRAPEQRPEIPGAPVSVAAVPQKRAALEQYAEALSRA